MPGWRAPGGVFGVHYRHQLIVFTPQGALNLVRVEDLPPRPVQPFYLGAVAAGHLHQPLAEISLDAHQDTVSRLDEVA